MANLEGLGKCLGVSAASAKNVGMLVVLGIMGAYVPKAQSDNLMDLWKLALNNDAKYLSASHKYLSDREITNLSRADLLPNLSFKYEHKSTDQTINESDNLVFASGSDKYPTKTYGFTLTQSIFDYSRWQRYDQAKISENRAEVDFQFARQDLILRLTEAYFLVLERLDQLETIQAEKAAMKKHLSETEKKLRSGLGTSVDVEDSRARYLNALSKEVELKSRLVDSRYGLREVTGQLPVELSALRPDIELQPPMPDSAEEWGSRSLQSNLELQSLNLSLKEADKEFEALRSEHYPTLDLVYENNNVNTEGSVFGGGSDIDNSVVILQLNVPLYSGGKTSSKYRQAVEKRNSVFQDRNEKQRSVERSTHDAYHRVGSAIQQIAALEQSVKSQERLLRAKTLGYRSGQNRMLEILDVQQDLSEVQQALTKARYDYVLNILRLKFSAGHLEEDDISIVNSWLVNSKQLSLRNDPQSVVLQ